MTIIKWDPMGDLNRMRQEMNKFLTAGPLSPSNWPIVSPEPRIDVYQTDEEIMVSVELPGLESKEDIEIMVEDNVIHISGEIKKNEELKEDNYYHRERYYGSFKRTVALPTDVRKEEAKASYKDGLLAIKVPRIEKRDFRGHKVDIH